MSSEHVLELQNPFSLNFHYSERRVRNRWCLSWKPVPGKLDVVLHRQAHRSWLYTIICVPPVDWGHQLVNRQ
uniref:Uncharacterized protein n=1 Tax=Anguilla anguilla TaxID=7936 RepID=A0A0E9WHC2_ANGAN